MRVRQLQELIKNSDLDAVLLTGDISRRYATGFPSSAGVAYISKQTAVFYTDFRYVEAAKSNIRGFDVREIRGKSYAEAVNEHIENDGVTKVALEDRTLTHDAFGRWLKSLSAEGIPLGGALEEMRIAKDDAEIEAIASAQRIAEQAFQEALNDIKVGVTEKEIAARLTYLMLHYGAENISFDPIVVSGANSSKPHGIPSEKQFEAGDFITMDFGCIRNGYCSDMTRTVAVSYATDDMRLVYDTVLQAQFAGIACCKAGIKASEVDAAARSVITKAGYAEAFGHGFGHGVGLEIHEAPNVSPRNDDPLPAGTVITAEPGIYLPERFGVRIEDMLYVIEDGCINLTEASKDLFIL